MTSSSRRRAEVRVGRLPEFTDYQQEFADVDSGFSTEAAVSMPAPCRRSQMRRAASDACQQPPRRPRAVPVRRLTVRRRYAEPATSSSPTVQLDLTGALDVRAEVAFHGQCDGVCLNSVAINSRAAAEQRRDARCKASSAWAGDRCRFVQVRNPLCVPRCSDNLATWRTCMVPIADLESFAFMRPPRQQWRKLTPRAQADALIFTLMSYNVLSDQYASTKSYWYCPEWALSWAYRRQGLMEIICNHLPSVLCLQEVETEQFYSFFLPMLRARGYDGIFSPKSRAKTMEARLRPRVDGCAILWKTCEFHLVDQQVIELSQQYLEQCWTTPNPATDTAASSEIFSRVSPRDNIALAAVLMPATEPASKSTDVTGGGPLLVCNSHVHWDPQHPDVKLIQTMLLTGALTAIVRRHGGRLPLLLCGDFNSLPQSGVIEFITLGSVPRNHPDFRRLGEDPSLDGLQAAAVAAAATETDTPAAAASAEAAGTSPDRLESRFSHQLALQSCYSGVDTAFTNYTHDFKGVIDYIFAARDHFRVLDCLDGLADWLRSEDVLGCPNAYMPSDHIPLMVRLQLLQLAAPPQLSTELSSTHL